MLERLLARYWPTQEVSVNGMLHWASETTTMCPHSRRSVGSRRRVTVSTATRVAEPSTLRMTATCGGAMPSRQTLMKRKLDPHTTTIAMKATTLSRSDRGPRVRTIDEPDLFPCRDAWAHRGRGGPKVVTC